MRFPSGEGTPQRASVRISRARPAAAEIDHKAGWFVSSEKPLAMILALCGIHSRWSTLKSCGPPSNEVSPLSIARKKIPSAFAYASWAPSGEIAPTVTWFSGRSEVMARYPSAGFWLGRKTKDVAATIAIAAAAPAASFHLVLFLDAG